jgi:hypothetical protein
MCVTWTYIRPISLIWVIRIEYLSIVVRGIKVTGEYRVSDTMEKSSVVQLQRAASVGKSKMLTTQWPPEFSGEFRNLILRLSYIDIVTDVHARDKR